MPYGILKADTLTYYTATGDVSIAISGLAISGSPLISGVSGIFTTSVSGATVTGNAGQFTTITGGTAQFTNITGVSGTFTSRISGATVTGTSGQFTTLTATTGVFTSVSGGTVSGDVGLFNTISGNQGVFNSSLSVPSGTAASPSISFNGDPNTGIYSSGADAVAISTNGTGRLFIDASGRVLAGAASTTVDASLVLQGNSANSAGASFLHLSRGSTPNTTGANLGIIRFSDNAQSIGAEILAYPEAAWTGSSYPTALILRTVSTGSTVATERLRITSAGLVGIGTSSPQQVLHATAANSSGFTGIRSQNSNGGTGIAGIEFSSDSTYAKAAIGQLRENANGAGPLVFYNSNSTGAANWSTSDARMVITSAGLVGIGTTSPGGKLHVDSGPIIFNAYSTESADNRQLRFSIDNTSYAHLSIPAGGGGALGIAVGAFERLRIDSSGRLLVGTSTSAGNNLLQIKGDAAATTGVGSIFLQRGLNIATIGSSGNVDLAKIEFGNQDGAVGAVIQANADATWSSNDYPSRLTFSTTADGASSPTERMRIAQNGVITIQNGAVAVIGTLTDGATITPDFAADCNFTVTLGGSRTMANPTNITAGQSGSIFIVQSTGSHTLSWGSYWDFPGGTAPTLSTAAGAVDRIDYIVRSSTSIHTVFTANYS